MWSQFLPFSSIALVMAVVYTTAFTTEKFDFSLRRVKLPGIAVRN